MVFHDAEMDGITRRQPLIPQDNLFRTFDYGPIHSQHLVHDAEQSVERGLDGVAAVDCDVAVQDLLGNLGVRNQALALADHLFEQPSRIALVGMRSALTPPAGSRRRARSSACRTHSAIDIWRERAAR